MNRPDALLDTLVAKRYRIVRVVGMGGMARVYEAQDETLGRRVALKVLDSRHAADAQFVERFLREASNAARLNYPNIVQVYDRGETDDGTWFIAMEFVDGRTLKDLVVQRGRLTEPEVLAYTRQALLALRFAHKNGVVHRDIKPHNLMVDNDGRVKIADFGIARAGTDAGLTEVGSIVGTAQYLSPEQARGEHVAASSDLYSLGVVMFELATGRVPFEGDSPVNVALKHVNEPVPSPRSLVPEITPALEAVILRAMQKDPVQRYSTADEMLADLDAAKRGQVSSETAAITQVLPASAAERTTIQSAPLTPPPAGVSGWAAEDRYRAAQRDGRAAPVVDRGAFADDELDPDRPRRRFGVLLLALVLLALLALAGWLALGQPGTGKGGNHPKTKTTAPAKTFAVPDVAGESPAQARSDLEAAGFTVGATTRRSSDTVDSGQVIETNPTAGTKLKRHAPVTLVVSSGVEQVAVPKLVDLSLDAATAAAKQAGFTLTSSEVESTDKDPGTVLEQTPGAGQQAARGSVIKVTVAKQATTVAVPDVSGLSTSAARSKLEALKLQVSVDKSQDGSNPENQVFGQDPASGATVRPGSTVTIQVGSGYNTVPSVLGQSEQEATQALRDQGYNVTVERTVGEDPNLPQSGQVTDQQPAADARLKLGFSVHITITAGTGTANKVRGRHHRHERHDHPD